MDTFVTDGLYVLSTVIQASPNPVGGQPAPAPPATSVIVDDLVPNPPKVEDVE